MTQTPDINTQPLAEVDPEIAAALADELGRQRGTLEMIASENFAPVAVLQAPQLSARPGSKCCRTFLPKRRPRSSRWSPTSTPYAGY